MPLSAPCRFDPAALEADPNELILLVTGAGLEAESADRTFAYALAETVREVLHAIDDPRPVVVASDLWYVNQPEVRRASTLAIGRPEINAACAMLARQVPTALVVDGRFRIQFDVEGIERRACAYGVDAATTREALRIFEERYLPVWLTAAP